MEYNRITLAVITKLQAIVGEKYVWTDEEKRIPYGRDEGTFTVPLLPDVVVLPETAEELAAVVLGQRSRHSRHSPRNRNGA